MYRSLLLVTALLVASAPAILAHIPPGPDLLCQPYTGGRYHDYAYRPGWLGAEGSYGAMGRHYSRDASFALDGNLADCAKPGPIQVRPGICHDLAAWLTEEPCIEYSTGVEQPLLDYDGEPEWGIGGAILFYETGDGVASGAIACYGWPSTGHHAGDIYALDVTGNGPQLTAFADRSLPLLRETPDCGDGILQPCGATDPRGMQPFPMNVILDTINGVLWRLDEPGSTCNAGDAYVVAASVVGDASRLSLTIGPGADGSVHVLVRQDMDTPILGTAGHIWTS